MQSEPCLLSHREKSEERRTKTRAIHDDCTKDYQSTCICMKGKNNEQPTRTEKSMVRDEVEVEEEEDDDEGR